jgi:dihydropyrimidinase
MSQAQVDLVLRNGVLLTGAGRFKAGVAINNGIIVAVCDDELLPPAKETIDLKGKWLMPGVVDSEAHPGCYVPFRYEMIHESRAAACAGVTTWGIQAPSTRLGLEPFKEFVQSDDVVPFSETFPIARDIINEVSHVDAFLTFMMETAAQADEVRRHFVQALYAGSPHPRERSQLAITARRPRGRH